MICIYYCDNLTQQPVRYTISPYMETELIGGVYDDSRKFTLSPEVSPSECIWFIPLWDEFYSVD